MSEKPASRRELKMFRHRLLGTISRGERVAEACLRQACDADLPHEKRVTAEQGAIRASKAVREMGETLTRVESALHEHAKDEAA